MPQSIKLAEEIIGKRPDEVRLINWDFQRDMAAGATVVEVDSVTVSPSTGSLAAIATTYSETFAQIKLTGGYTEKQFSTASSTGLFTITAHGLSDGDTVRLRVDEAESSLPGGFNTEEPYYVRDSTTDTFALAERSGGDALVVTSDGDGVLYMEYVVTVTVTTSSGQRLVGLGRVWSRQ